MSGREKTEEPSFTLVTPMEREEDYRKERSI